jgi:hypothetical protein
VKRLTYANVLATAAAFLALTGVGFAATKLPAGSVGTAQLRSAAVTPTKLGKAARGLGHGGPRGATGRAGAPGPAGAPGKDATVGEPLPSGATERGIFAGGAGSSAASTFIAATADFSRPLAAPLKGGNAVVLAAGEASAPGCPGVGEAEPGFFCAYTYEESNAEVDANPSDPANTNFAADVAGVQFFYQARNPLEGSYAFGSWALTAR